MEQFCWGVIESTLLQEFEVTSKLDHIKLLKVISGHYSALWEMMHTLNLNAVNFVAVVLHFGQVL